MLQLLGPVELAGAVDPPAWSPRQRLVLAALAVDAGRPVPVAHLVDRVWGTEPPPEAHRTLQAYIARCRRHLAGTPVAPGSFARIERRAGGYQLQAEPDRIDLHRFRHLVVMAREVSCPPPRRIELLREATGLWRGQPLAGLSGGWVERTRHAWRQEQITAVVAWAEAELTAGDPRAVLGAVTDLASENPWCEPLLAVLIRILGRLGRTAEALRTFQEVRHRLADELGVDPGTELRDAHQAVLRGEVGRGVDTSPPATAAAATVEVNPVRDVDAVARPGPVPAQLPLNLGVFAGRTREIAALDRRLPTASAETALVVLSGTAGIGKSALAVRWAHRVAERFPDGQLFVNLRAFGPEPHGVEPTEAIRRFLDALGVPPDRIPGGDLDAQSAVYRSAMAGRRMLVVLDNAGEAEQVRPLLPGAPGSLVLVTSRNQLTGLLARDGGHLITLDPLPPDEATELLGRRLGAQRVAAEPRAVRELVAGCGRLPLALAIVAARAATRPDRPLAEVVGSLRDGGTRLDALTDVADPSLDVRAGSPGRTGPSPRRPPGCSGCWACISVPSSRSRPPPASPERPPRRCGCCWTVSWVPTC
ncbi:BTAD domain-containing putative transcriptional regulator [Plantactinospora siamensis]|uniref:BTAD domain-containing putative transcriptional regulator n=1 Tax=Plantactinospora siamensis TaxID=555372 RepID=A0ABV6P4Z4_9ACTN